MIYLLPAPIRGVLSLTLQLFPRAKGLFASKNVKYKLPSEDCNFTSFKYKLATILDLFLIFLILVFGRQPAQKLTSPLVSSLHSFYSITQRKTTSETFAFVPDLAPNKFPSIDLDGLTELSFFDIPITENGELNYYSRGYQSFSSDETQALFDRARSQKTKIFLTLSATDGQIIQSVLNNPNSAQTLADETTQEIKNSGLDGVTVDFEFPQNGGRDYQNKFTNFIKEFNDRIHNSSPEIQLAVAVPSNLTNNQDLYNIEDLSQNSDRIFLIASDFIVPEFKNAAFSNPLYGYDANDYWAGVSNLIGNLEKRVPWNKLVMERAWYGNGNNYPLYTPNSKQEIGQNSQPAEPASLDGDAIEKLIAGVPHKGKEAARKNIPLIARALKNEGILDSNVLAYALATVEHETDETFAPIEEIQGRENARRLGYEGGENYFGRGFIQITHLRNYRQIGERIGLGDKLARNPDLASDPEIAAEILAAFFKDNNVANLASSGDFIDARTPINPDYNGRSVAQLAMKYEI